MLFLLQRTIMEGRSSLASERTSVASLHRWTPPQNPNVTALLYDVGGHKSYQNTAHCFQVCLFSAIVSPYILLIASEWNDYFSLTS